MHGCEKLMETVAKQIYNGCNKISRNIYDVKFESNSVSKREHGIWPKMMLNTTDFIIVKY